MTSKYNFKFLFEVFLILFVLYILESTVPLVVILFKFSNDWSLFLFQQLSVLTLLIYSFVIMKRWNINIRAQINKPKIIDILVVVLITSLFIISMIPLFHPLEFIRKIIGGNIDLIEIYIPNINSSLTKCKFINSILIVPIIEEIFYRGIILTRLKKNFSSKKSILISSIIFAISHYRFSRLIGTFFYGLLFGVVFHKYGSLKLSILSHSLINLIVHFAIIKTQPMPTNMSLYLIVYLFCGFGFYFSVKIFWLAKKEKLFNNDQLST